MGTTEEPYTVSNLVNGNWVKAKSTITIPHPMDCDAHPIFAIPDTTSEELGPFIESLKSVPKSGVHNPLKNPNRYVEYGEISRKVSVSLDSQHLLHFIALKAKNRLAWKHRAKNGLTNALRRLIICLSTLCVHCARFCKIFAMVWFVLVEGWTCTKHP